jgi:hypothetical protein
MVAPRLPQDQCDERLRADLDLAASVRAAIGIDGVDDTIEAARVAANDPDADTSRYGIPITQGELALVDQSGAGDDATVGLAGLTAARPDVFNALWWEADQLTVSVLRADTLLLEEARCLERVGADGGVRYVTAGIPVDELNALGDRINADRDDLLREGIEVTIVAADPTTETVQVGLQDVADDVVARLVERYGNVVQVVQASAPRPIPQAPAQPGPGG